MPSASRHWLPQITFTLAILILAAPFGGFLYQNISLIRERRANPMPGRLVAFGGYKMHLDCTGQGSPPVVLDSGLGDSFVEWQTVQSQIAKFVQVCSYDRAGMGYSEASPRPRTARVFAEELHSLVHAAGLQPPYILVGHSMAGFTLRLYAARYRSDVAGIVLVDSSHPDQFKRLPPDPPGTNAKWIQEAEFLELTTPIGIPRLLGYCGDPAALRAAECTFEDARENTAERRTFRESAAQAGAAGDLGDLPLLVLSHRLNHHDPEVSANLEAATNRAFDEMQQELTRLSTRGRRIIAENSGHYIQHDRPDVVIAAVHQMVDECRQPGNRRAPAITSTQHAP